MKTNLLLVASLLVLPVKAMHSPLRQEPFNTHQVIGSSLGAPIPTDEDDAELQLVLALSLEEYDEEQVAAVVDNEQQPFDADELESALYASLNQPLFDLIKVKGSEDKAIRLLNQGLDIAVMQDGCSVLECAAKAQAVDIVRACMRYAQYPCPTWGEYKSSLERLKTLFLVANRFKAERSVKRHIVFSDQSLVRDYIKVQYYNLCNGRKLSDFAQKVVEKILPYLALDHVGFLLEDAHESAGNDEIKRMVDPQTFGEQFGRDLCRNVEFKLFDLDKAAK